MADNTQRVTIRLPRNHVRSVESFAAELNTNRHALIKAMVAVLVEDGQLGDLATESQKVKTPETV